MYSCELFVHPHLHMNTIVQIKNPALYRTGLLKQVVLCYSTGLLPSTNTVTLLLSTSTKPPCIW
jgi:hypothetical protein